MLVALSSMFGRKGSRYVPKYFTEKEFQAVGCSIRDMQPEFLRMLDNARREAGVPFVITSALRSVENELSKGRSGKSAHTRGKAVDVACNSSWIRYKIVTGALKAGFQRIGIHGCYVHLDNDDEVLPSPRIWTY